MKEIEPVSGEDMAEWCELLADDNAIHLSRSAAEAAGFGPRRVNPGPANLAYLLACLDPEAEGTVTEIDARFLGNVLEDDRLQAHFEDGEARLERAGERVVLAKITQAS